MSRLSGVPRAEVFLTTKVQRHMTSAKAMPATVEASVRALKLMLDDHAYGLSRRRVTVSTAGRVRMEQ